MAAAISALYQRARQSMLKGHYEPAYHDLLAIVRLDPEYHAAYFLLSRIAFNFHNVDKEIEMLEKAVGFSPANPEYQAHLARALAVKGKVEKALAVINTAKLLPGQTALSLDTLGTAYNRLCLYEQASRCFEEAILLEKNNPAMYFNLASALKFCGRFAESGAAYENAIALNPHYYKAHAALTSLGQITPEHNHVTRLRSLYSEITSADDRLHIAHALSKELEALQEFDEAFHYLQDAKAKKRQQWHYQVDDDLAIFDALQEYFSSDDFDGVVGQSSKLTPIFVVGMPRSGTTLVERLLSNHPDVATAGELPTFSLIVKSLLNIQSPRLLDKNIIFASHRLPYADVGKHYLQSTAHHYQGRHYLVDKLPLNGLYAGHILRALPQARVICLDRERRDTAFSNYRQLFNFNELTYGYSLSLEDSLLYTSAFKSLSAFWQSRFADRFYQVNYENLVTNPEHEAGKLFEFCGLDFNAAHLDIQSNTNPVATASSVQVRSAISTRSIQQWLRYAKHVNAAIACLSTRGK